MRTAYLERLGHVWEEVLGPTGLVQVATGVWMESGETRFSFDDDGWLLVVSCLTGLTIARVPTARVIVVLENA